MQQARGQRHGGQGHHLGHVQRRTRTTFYKYSNPKAPARARAKPLRRRDSSVRVSFNFHPRPPISGWRSEFSVDVDPTVFEVNKPSGILHFSSASQTPGWRPGFSEVADNVTFRRETSSNGGCLHDLVVYTKNARLHSDSKLTELLGELNMIRDNWDIVLFSETRRACGMVDLDGGHRLYASHQPTTCAGVAILVHGRHCSNVQRTAVVNDRLMYVDIKVSNKTTRFAAIYVPHAGYADADLRLVYDGLYCVLEEARSNSFACIVGGDFNTQLHIGMRGDLLMQTLHMYQLHVANDDDSDHDNTWTFCSSMGVKRRIDYILYTRNFAARRAKASDDLDLGSDHRSVVAIFHRQSTHQKKRGRRHHAQYDWSPSQIIRYQRSLANSLVTDPPAHFADIESRVVTCAREVAQKSIVCESKPWQNPDVQHLMSLRRGCRDRLERCRLSKLIQKHLRREMRSKRNAKLERVLHEFRDLNRLESVWHDPVKPSCSDHAQDPSPREFADYLSGVFASTVDDSRHESPQRGFNIPAFTLPELKHAMCHLRKGKSADSQGVVVEMLRYAPDDLLNSLLELYNCFFARRVHGPIVETYGIYNVGEARRQV